MNFNVAMFTNPSATGFGVIIGNDKGEVMAASSARGAPASGSEEAEVLACCHVVEFALGLSLPLSLLCITSLILELSLLI